MSEDYFLHPKMVGHVDVIVSQLLYVSREFRAAITPEGTLDAHGRGRLDPTPEVAIQRVVCSGCGERYEGKVEDHAGSLLGMDDMKREEE